MKPIWIVDDDQSIRFVLEKALGREGGNPAKRWGSQGVQGAAYRASTDLQYVRIDHRGAHVRMT